MDDISKEVTNQCTELDDQITQVSLRMNQIQKDTIERMKEVGDQVTEIASQIYSIVTGKIRQSTKLGNQLVENSSKQVNSTETGTSGQSADPAHKDYPELLSAINDLKAITEVKFCTNVLVENLDSMLQNFMTLISK